ncbi:hypothetical protein ACIA03_06090 [Nocardioides sp. NPDC051685]|uniref:hypothetical protein n=1 Tax=Nocardioides sp. NPDC051685 TaxID=3364334 RepID=UPI0037982136
MPRPNPERDAQALRLHLAGASYADIAKAMGWAHKPAAFKAVRRALASARTTVDLREAADTELLRLDAMLTGLWPKARRGEPEAVDRVLRISRRQGELRDLLDQEPPPPPDRETGLSEFERRMREREHRRHQ